MLSKILSFFYQFKLTNYFPTFLKFSKDKISKHFDYAHFLSQVIIEYISFMLITFSFLFFGCVDCGERRGWVVVVWLTNTTKWTTNATWFQFWYHNHWCCEFIYMKERSYWLLAGFIVRKKCPPWLKLWRCFLTMFTKLIIWKLKATTQFQLSEWCMEFISFC